MQKFYFLLFIVFTSMGVSAQPNVIFEKNYGTPSTEDTGNSVIELEDGNVLYVGTSNIELRGSDVYVVKADKDGNEIWSKNYGTEENEVGLIARELEDGNIMLAGTTQIPKYIGSGVFSDYLTHAYLLKLDKNGNEIWSKIISISSYNANVPNLTFDSDGSLLLLVSTKMVMKFDAEGEKVWSKNTSAMNLTDRKSIRGSSETGFLITGTEYIYESSPQGGNRYRTAQTIKIDGEGELQWSVTIEGVNGWVGKDAIFTKSGDCVMLADAYEDGNSIMIQKVDNSGQVIWTKEHSVSDGNIEAQRLLESENGDLYIVGEGFVSTSKRKDAFVLKLDNNGEKIKMTNYDFGTEEIGKDLIESNNGEFLLVGNTSSFNGTGEDVLGMRINSDGAVLWQSSFGEAGNAHDEVASELLQLSEGGYLVGAHSNSVSELGDSDIYLLQLDENGEIQWEKNLDFFHGQDYCYQLAEVGESGYAVWGSSENEEGTSALQLTRIDSEANVLWVKRFELLSSQADNGFSLLPDGGFVVCGALANTAEMSYYAKLDAQGVVVWEYDYKAWGLSSIKPTSDGGFILSGRGETLIQNGGSMDGWSYVPMEILKINAQGTPVWKFHRGMPSNTYVRTLHTDVIELSSGNFVWMGNRYYEDSPSIYIGMLSDTGDEVWTDHLGVAPESLGFSLTETNDGSVLITGADIQYYGENGAIWAKVNCEGEKEWNQIFPDEPTGDFHFTSGFQTEEGNLVILGNKTINNSSEMVFLKSEALSNSENPCQATSIENLYYNSSSLQLKPNLSRDFVQLDFAGEYTGKIAINVFDIAGRLTHSIEGNKQEANFQTWLNIKNWNEGLYIVEVLTTNQRYTQKLVKQ